MTDARTGETPLGTHGADVHEGFAREDGDFEAQREQRTELVRQFIETMNAAGNPGLSRKLGSTVLQLTGQGPEHYWSTMLRDEDGNEREVLVFDSGVHGWSDEISYSDRPRTPADEITADMLERALDQILDEQGVTKSPRR